MEELKNLLKQALKYDYYINLFDYDINMSKYVKIQCYNIHNRSKIYYAYIEYNHENDTTHLDYFNTPKNKRLANLLQKILYKIKQLQTDKHRYKNLSKEIVSIFKNYAEKAKLIYTTKYSN